jgi:hypothetical protein
MSGTDFQQPKRKEGSIEGRKKRKNNDFKIGDIFPNNKNNSDGYRVGFRLFILNL